MQALWGWLIVAAICMVLTCACQPTAPPVEKNTAIGAELQSLVEGAVADSPSVYGAALAVSAPALQLNWQGAAGQADPATGTPMTAAHPVRIASNTKTYVAAGVLRLWEEGQLDLDDPVAEHLPEDFVSLLSGDGYDPQMITIRHLLTHSSGLFDHSDGEAYGERIVAEPDHHWTRAEQLQAAVDWGEPWAAPGEIYRYADTGYILLGEIIEQRTGLDLGVALRALLRYEELGLDATWWETVELQPESVPERAHQFLGELDTTDFHPSFDLYGGGGIACPVGDLARFTEALFNGEVFAETNTLPTMLTTIDGTRAAPDADESHLPPNAYRMGVWVLEVEGFTVYRHTGFWGTLADYVPELGVTIAVTVNQNQGKSTMVELARQALLAVAAEQPRTTG